MSRPKSQVFNQLIGTENLIATPVAHNDSYEEDFSYIDRQGIIDFCESTRGTTNMTHRSSRHNASKCCDVPALQSPKNAVAPTQTLIATSNQPTDFTGNIQKVKTALADQQMIHKELENNKINQSDDKTNVTSCQTNIISTLMQNGQNCSTRQSSIITNNNTSPQQIYFNNPTESQGLQYLVLQSCHTSYINGKNNKSSCFVSNTNSVLLNSQISQFSHLPSSHFSKCSLGSSGGSNSPTCSYQPSSMNFSTSCGSTQCMNKRKDEKTISCCAKPGGNHTNQVGVLPGKNEELRFIDEDFIKSDMECIAQTHAVHRTPTVASIGPLYSALDPMIRSCSVGYLDLVDAQMVPCDIALKMLRKEAPNKRLVLVSRKTRRKKINKRHEIAHEKNKLKLFTCGKSKSLDSNDVFPHCEHNALRLKLADPLEEASRLAADISDSSGIDNNDQNSYNSTNNESDCIDDKDKICIDNKSSEAKSSFSLASSLDGLAARLRDFDDCYSLPPPSPRSSSTRLPRSSPASSPSSPAPSKKGKRPASASPIRRRLLSSPLLSRRMHKNRGESSDDDIQGPDESPKSYKNLETFQKAQLRQKVKNPPFFPNSFCRLLFSKFISV